ncbi:hypothetical protein MN188_13490 [Aliiroseovarius sp. N1Y82]|uniref:hypothetical protein n=1 Tax=Aliiroseovarius subalbicans TaxID=2925840 RepID=UPI001F58F026|nr:hypothetical protein [Aliiroseovarius subalbicans]MCI2400406.1 hypothetical protein [Aliiroseovarius subalbicans]
MSTLVGSAAHADQPVLVYEKILDHPYTQSWSTVYLGRISDNQHEVYLRGDGKIGDFFGVLYLDCDEPKYSRWEAQGGMIDTSEVPGQAIVGIRKTYCD